MSKKENVNEKELEQVSGGAGMKNLLNTTGANAKTALGTEGGFYGDSAPKTLLERGSSVTKKSFLARLVARFRGGKNTQAGVSAVASAKDSKDMLA